MDKNKWFKVTAVYGVGDIHRIEQIIHRYTELKSDYYV